MPERRQPGQLSGQQAASASSTTSTASTRSDPGKRARVSRSGPEIIPAIPDGWGGHANIADDESPMISVTDGDSDCESGRETMEMDSHDGLSPIDSTGDADETIFSHAFDPFSDDLPPMPTDPPWTPTKTVAEWTETLHGWIPLPIRRWISQFEPSMRCPWACMIAEHREMLPVLTAYVKEFAPCDRRGAMWHLFDTKGLLEGHKDMFEHMFCGLPREFGHVDFRADDDTSTVRAVMSVADCFLSLVDAEGFSPALHWSPLPAARDPTDFKAGGVHSKEARRAWDEFHESGPGVSSWVLSWVHNRVWFAKNRPHKVDHSARNAPCLDPEHPKFEETKHEFMARKVAEMVRVGAALELPDDSPPDVLTRLSLAPKPGKGDPWRVIMDMRPENECYDAKKTRMEHLAHVPAVFTGRELLFSCDLKSAYYSVGVDPRLGRTMGFKWGGKFYRFTCLPFGFALAPYAFVKVGRQILKKWRAMGPGSWASRFEGKAWPEVADGSVGGGCRSMIYIDDSLTGHELFGAAVWLRNAQMLEFERLGFSMSAKGELLPFPMQRFLGMNMHFGQPTPSWHLPDDKRTELMDVVTAILNDSAAGPVKCKLVARCIGKLISATRAVPISRLLFRELNWAIYDKGSPNWLGSLDVPPAALRDLKWILQCFQPFNTRGSPIWVASTITQVDRVLIQDAGPRAIGFAVHEVSDLTAASSDMLPIENSGLLVGRGHRVSGIDPSPPRQCALPAEPASPSHATASDVVDSLSVATSCGTIELTDAECDLHHVQKELLGTFLALHSRREELRHKRVCIFVDATATVAYLSQWGGRSRVLTGIVRKIWGLCAAWGLRIVQVSHISGNKMISAGVDALSRPMRFARGGVSERDDWRVVKEAFLWVQSVAMLWLGGALTIDRMASRANRRLTRFNSVSSADPDSEGFSAFATSWADERNYCFPPFAFIPRVLQHVEESSAVAAVIVPEWPSQCWWQNMISLARHISPFPMWPVFERVADGEWVPVTRMPFRPLLVVLDGGLVSR